MNNYFKSGRYIRKLEQAYKYDKIKKEIQNETQKKTQKKNNPKK